MPYSILVFNRKNLGSFTEGSLINAITESNYETLCSQYALDPSLVEPAINHLEVIRARNDPLPYFLLKYGAGQSQTVLVQRWDAGVNGGKDLLQAVVEGIDQGPLKIRLKETRRVIEITLEPVQLKEMGLLLAYEVARWAADRGEGVMYGLDGTWYRLNQHKAFVPVKYLEK